MRPASHRFRRFETDRERAGRVSTERILNLKRLPVLNHAAPSASTAYVLDDPGQSADGPLRPPEELRKGVIDQLRQIYDPEIPLNIYDLGLIYGLDISDEGLIDMKITLTSPGCPVAGVLIRQAHDQVRKVTGARRVRTELVWDPPWSKERLSPAARLALGIM